MLRTEDLKLTFLGAVPFLKDETGILTPQEIASLGAVLTFKGKSVQELKAEAIRKGKEIKDYTKKILFESALRGHSSMATTPVLAFLFEGGKFLDSVLTAFTFSSGLMASGRRTDSKAEEIVFPSSILKANEDTQKIYSETSERNIAFVQQLLAAGVSKDEASKMLPYGIYGTGIVQFSLETLVALKREYESQKEWMPEEIGFLLEQVEAQLKELGVDLLYWMRLAAPRNTYPYPNIFKNPEIGDQTWNLRRELGRDDFKIISHDFSGFNPEELNLKFFEISRRTRSILEANRIKDDWPELLEMRHKVCRDYKLSASLKMLSCVSWRVWGEKKRHRTVTMVVNSVYEAVENCWDFFDYNGGMKNTDAEELGRFFSIPPAIKINPTLLSSWIMRVYQSLKAHSRLVESGIPHRDALFIIPRCIKLHVLQLYDIHNLVDGYYPLRLCGTAEEEMRRMTTREAEAIKNLFCEAGMKHLAESIVPKCQIVGFCLEPWQKCCGLIKKLRPDYNEDVHKEMMEHLKKKSGV